MIRVAQEFSRFANDYSKHNSIQSQVAQKLITTLPTKKYDHIVDIGCGRGEVYANLLARDISFEEFVAFDISDEMLALHPKDEHVSLIQGDFNNSAGFAKLPNNKYDLLLSSSAIQWSSDLSKTLYNISQLSEHFYFAIFTSGTFRSLHQCAGISSPIYSVDRLKEQIDRYFDAHYERVEYTLHFDDTYNMLRYIKESGTNGGRQHLSYRQTKELIERYPFDYLEFEVLFVTPKH